MLAVLLGALDIFSLAAWAAVPARVAKVQHENIGTAATALAGRNSADSVERQAYQPTEHEDIVQRSANARPS